MIRVFVKPFLHISDAMAKKGEFHVDLDGLETRLEQGAAISIFPLVAGG